MQWTAEKSSFLGFETLQKQNFSASRLQRPGMTSPLKQLLADCLKTFRGRPEDWTVSGSWHLYQMRLFAQFHVLDIYQKFR